MCPSRTGPSPAAVQAVISVPGKSKRSRRAMPKCGTSSGRVPTPGLRDEHLCVEEAQRPVGRKAPRRESMAVPPAPLRQPDGESAELHTTKSKRAAQKPRPIEVGLRARTRFTAFRHRSQLRFGGFRAESPAPAAIAQDVVPMPRLVLSSRPAPHRRQFPCFQFRPPSLKFRAAPCLEMCSTGRRLLGGRSQWLPRISGMVIGKGRVPGRSAASR